LKFSLIVIPLSDSSFSASAFLFLGFALGFAFGLLSSVLDGCSGFGFGLAAAFGLAGFA